MGDTTILFFNLILLICNGSNNKAIHEVTMESKKVVDKAF
jgi:hypothetical protein